MTSSGSPQFLLASGFRPSRSRPRSAGTCAKDWTDPRRAPGRHRTAPATTGAGRELARDNPGWDPRIYGEVADLAHKIAVDRVADQGRGHRPPH